MSQALIDTTAASAMDEAMEWGAAHRRLVAHPAGQPKSWQAETSCVDRGSCV